MTEELTIRDLVAFMERLGPELGWSSAYIDLVATTTGAVFRGMGLDESKDVVLIGPTVLMLQLDQLEADLRKRGRSESTIRTYTNTWKRLSEIAGEWIAVRGTPKEDYFWENVHRYRDTRPKRRTTRASAAKAREMAAAESLPASHSGSVPTGSQEVIEVPLDEGVAVIVLPKKISQAEATRVIGALLGEGVDERL